MPSWKITVDSTEIENDKATQIICKRPENGISSLELVMSDYKSSTFSDIIDLFDNIQLELSNKNPSYTTPFYGEVYAMQPAMSPELLTVYCKGMEHCIDLTHNDSSYGTESQNPTIDTPREIMQDIIQNHVENSFGDAEATNWGLNESSTYVEDVHSALSITNLTSKYLSNHTLINRLCDIVNAYAITLGTPEPGIHWYFDPTPAGTTSNRFYVKEIGDDHSTGNWNKYYGGSQADATVTQGTDILSYEFHQSMEHYANNVVLACTLRKPATDYWTEDSGGAALWGNDSLTSISDENGAGLYVVGSHSLKLNITAPDTTGYAYYPSTEDAGWDFTKIGSELSPPTVNFYYRKTSETNEPACSLRFCTADHTTDYYYSLAFGDWTSDPDDTWIHRSIPIGPYWKTTDEKRLFRWIANGSPDWTDINCIAIRVTPNPGTSCSLYIDDLFLGGQIIREARDASEVGNYNERQVFLRLDTALDDSFNTSDNTGTAARLAASELFKRSQFKTAAANRFLTGTITLPMKEDLLPGQQLHIHCGKKSDGTYRYDLDMRCKEVKHIVSPAGYITQVSVTSDLWNSLTFDTPSAWGILQESAGALGHAEARDLKASGVDINVPRLTWDPTV